MKSNSPTLSALLTFAFLTTLASAQHATPSGPIVLKGKTNMVIKGLHITSTSGDCVQIISSSNITIENSEIGPCAGNGVAISGGTGISVFDSYIHPETLTHECCDHNDGVFASSTSNLSIQGNVIAYSESNIEVHAGNTVTVIGNLLLNPRGPGQARGNNFQCWGGCSNVLVDNNYALSSMDSSKYRYPEATQDSLSFGMSDHIIARNNYLSGGHSKNGCGLIADYRANNVEFLNNVLVNTGQCGIGIADGTNQVVAGNKIANRTSVAGSGNQALYVWQSYGAQGECALVTVSNNTAFQLKPDGTVSGFWKGQGCDPTTLSGNTFGKAAMTALAPQASVAPAIPPQPKNCVVASPYSTQVGWPSCTQ